MPSLCPVCGYELGSVPWNEGYASHEICRSCGIEFGYDDGSMRDATPDERRFVYERWRERWVRSGMPWFSSVSRPEGWNPREQMGRLGIRRDGQGTPGRTLSQQAYRELFHA